MFSSCDIVAIKLVDYIQFFERSNIFQDRVPCLLFPYLADVGDSGKKIFFPSTTILNGAWLFSPGSAEQVIATLNVCHRWDQRWLVHSRLSNCRTCTVWQTTPIFVTDAGVFQRVNNGFPLFAFQTGCGPGWNVHTRPVFSHAVGFGEPAKFIPAVGYPLAVVLAAMDGSPRQLWQSAKQWLGKLK